MNQINKILHHPDYQHAVKTIEEAEKDRVFCKHDFDHFLAVARLAYIDSLEKELAIPKTIIYSAALLHDIGRAMEYTEQIPHQQAGASMAEKILSECGFSQQERSMIVSAILSHREQDGAQKNSFSSLIYRADKGSRNCFCCKARKECKWPEDKMNLDIHT